MADTKNSVTATVDTKADVAKANASEQSRPHHGFCRCLWRFCKWSFAALVLLLFALGGALYYFIFTLPGAQKALEIAQNFIPQSIIIDTSIEGGSVWEGLRLGKTLVDIKDVVTINADDLVLEYDLMQMQQKLFKVHTLESNNLTVALSDKIFEPSTDPEEPKDPNAPPFRLNFPVDIDIDRFAVHGFAFNSQIVDVDLKDLQAMLWARADNLGINGADVDTLTVHLKNESDIAQEEAESAAATRADESLAVAVNGKVVPLTDANQAVEAVVTAAQQGQSVEMVMVRESSAREAAKTEEQVLSALKENEADKVYSDPEHYAHAIEDALLNNKKVPTFVNQRLHIHSPQNTIDPELEDVAYNLSEEELELNLMAQATATEEVVQESLQAAAAGDRDNDGDIDVVVEGDASSVEGAVDGNADGAALANANANGAKSTAIKEFGSGNGAIAAMPTVVLPFNAEVKDFKIKSVRYYMEGFDTQRGDVALSATWYDTKLEVQELSVDHGFGEADLTGSLNFADYFDLDVALKAIGAQNEETKALFEGILYGLTGDFKVSGNLTDLKVVSTLNLGGTTELKARANVLSAALPMRVSLQTRDFTYPIFGEPLVNLKHIDLKTAGNLEDGVDVNLKSLVSGFDFEDVSADVKAQVSYEMSHIDHLVVDGLYQKEKLSANVSGDVFYGSVLGVDAKVFAQVKDAGFLSPMLKGPLKVDGDLVAIMNQNEKGRTAVSTATEPMYLAYRIPKTTVLMEDFDPDTIEAKLLAQVKTGGLKNSRFQSSTGGSNSQLAANRSDTCAGGAHGAHGVYGAYGAHAGSDASLGQRMSTMGQSLRAVAVTAMNGIVSTASADNIEAALLASDSGYVEADSLGIDVSGDVSEAALLAGVSYTPTMNHEISAGAVRAVSAGESLSAVRPLRRPTTLAGGVADGPTDLLISQDEYVDAVRFTDVAVPSVDENGEPTVLSSIFNKDMPEVMANVRYLKGSLYFNGMPTTIDIANIVGDLQQGFRVEKLNVTQGKNVVVAEGQVTDRSADLNAMIDIQDFSTLVPSLQGSLAAQVVTSGSIRDLNFDITGSAPLIRSGDMRIRKLAFNSAFNMQTRALSFTALADRVRLAKGMAANRQCFIDLSGTPLRHSLSANCGGVTSAYINIDASLNLPENNYSANLLELYLSTENAGSLSLQRPVYLDLNLSDMSGTVTPIDLRGEIGQLSVEKTSFSPMYTESHVTVREFNLNSLSDFYPESIKMMVPLNVDADIMVENGKPDIMVAITSEEGVIFSTLGAGFVYDSFTISSHITAALMRTDIDMALRRDRGLVTSRIDVIDPMGKGKLDGYFKIIDFDLATISNIGQSFTELTGMTNVDTTFGGDLSAPMIYGSITSKGTAVPRYDVGQINDFDFNLQLNGNHGRLDGKVVLNGGALNLGGDLDWSEGANGSLVAQAKDLPVFLVGYGIARANLDANVTLGEILDINGKVDIPSARISVNNMASSGTTVSGDEILVPKEGTQVLMKEAPSNFKSAMDLAVNFGDNVNFEAMGMVQGRLAGGIAIKKQVSDNTIKATGEINVVDGTADVYGRKFSISAARVMFFNDIANPNLNVEVIADKDYIEDDVEVGVRVTGTASAPDINLFSKPTLSQNEILSYILYGHGLDKSAINQDSNNSNLLLGLGVSGVSGLMSSVASSFGVRDVQLNTQGSGDETQVSVQGYINRRLRISYGYGIFSAVGEFKVRYELIQNLYAEFVSSIDQAVDLVYSFEFD